MKDYAYHPTLGICIRSDGLICLPATKRRKKAVWTYGYMKSSGYMQIVLSKKTYLVHRLVAETFIQFPIPDGLQVDHINRRKNDNRVENIRLVTPSTNCRNTEQHDRVEKRDHAHTYDNPKAYRHERHKRMYADPAQRSIILQKNHEYIKENPEKQRAYNKTYYNSPKGKESYRIRSERFSANHKRVRFADKKTYWVTNERAVELLKMPVSLRIPPKNTENNPK